MKRIHVAITASLLLLISALFPSGTSAYIDLVNPWDKGPYKVFTVNFTHELDEQSVNKDTVYILDNNQKPVPNLDYAIFGDQLRIYSTEGFEDGTHELHLTTGIHSKSGKALNEMATKEFFVDNSKFYGELHAMEMKDWMEEGMTKTDLEGKLLPNLQDDTDTTVTYPTMKYGYEAEITFYFTEGKLSALNWRIPVHYTSFPSLQAVFEIITPHARNEFGLFDTIKLDPYSHEIYKTTFYDMPVRLEYNMGEYYVDLTVNKEIEDEIVVPDEEFDIELEEPLFKE